MSGQDLKVKFGVNALIRTCFAHIYGVAKKKKNQKDDEFLSYILCISDEFS